MPANRGFARGHEAHYIDSGVRLSFRFMRFHSSRPSALPQSMGIVRAAATRSQPLLGSDDRAGRLVPRHGRHRQGAFHCGNGHAPRPHHRFGSPGPAVTCLLKARLHVSWAYQHRLDIIRAAIPFASGCQRAHGVFRRRSITSSTEGSTCPRVEPTFTIMPLRRDAHVRDHQLCHTEEARRSSPPSGCAFVPWARARRAA